MTTSGLLSSQRPPFVITNAVVCASPEGGTLITLGKIEPKVEPEPPVAVTCWTGPADQSTTNDTYTLEIFGKIYKWGFEDVTMELDLDKILTVA